MFLNLRPVFSRLAFADHDDFQFGVRAMELLQLRRERIAWTAAALAAGITGCIGLFGVTLPDVWTSLFTKAPDIVLAAGYLAITGVAYAFCGLGLTLASAFQAAGRPLWPLVGITSRAVVVSAGGWIVVHLPGMALGGLAAVAAAGLTVYGASLAIAFRLWRMWQPQTASAARQT